ncbi:MAG TPA: DUF1572 family protein [Thermoanaerobaculia bacterium]|nr:DUF1572 family protein [Thermoanaerobaculia bacterium]
MTDSPASLYLKDVVDQFFKLKDLGDKALAQVGDEDLFTVLDPESNSLAILLQHMAGNLRSRWTDFLNSDGEKPDRDRDSEFEVAGSITRERLMERWEEGWRCLFQALAALSEEDLAMTILIRAEPHSVIKAINRQLTHYGYHVGQIVFLAKHFASDHWKTLSVPRGGSSAFNAAKMGKARPPGA